MTATIDVDGETVAIEPRKINLIFHGGIVNVAFPDCVTIDPDASRYHGSRVKRLHKLTLGLVEMIEAGRRLPDGSDARNHVVGLIDLSLKLQDQGLPVAWKFPETYLHPYHQANLGDVVITLGNRQ